MNLNISKCCGLKFKALQLWVPKSPWSRVSQVPRLILQFYWALMGPDTVTLRSLLRPQPAPHKPHGGSSYLRAMHE